MAKPRRPKDSFRRSVLEQTTNAGVSKLDGTVPAGVTTNMAMPSHPEAPSFSLVQEHGQLASEIERRNRLLGAWAIAIPSKDDD